MNPGTTLGNRFQVDRKLGVGGMGAVYAATDLTTGDKVALKVVRIERLSDDSSISRRFEREARAVGTLATPHVVRFVDAGEDATSGAYLAMELLEGFDLRQLFTLHAPLPVELAVRIAAQAARGIAEAHAVGVVHRDVKPANLFAARGPGESVTIKVLDFGIAKFDGSALHESTSLSLSGSVLGSPAYMSPEQALGGDDVDARTDVWSLGVVLYEALSGRLPFGDKLPLAQALVSIVSEPPVGLDRAAPWVPEPVRAVVHRAIAKRREERFASMRLMLDALLALSPSGDSLTWSMLRSATEGERSTPPPMVIRSVDAEAAATFTGTASPLRDQAHPLTDPLTTEPRAEMGRNRRVALVSGGLALGAALVAGAAALARPGSVGTGPEAPRAPHVLEAVRPEAAPPTAGEPAALEPMPSPEGTVEPKTTRDGGALPKELVPPNPRPLPRPRDPGSTRSNRAPAPTSREPVDPYAP